MPASFAAPLVPQIRKDYRYCRKLTHRCGPNFSVGFRCLPRAKRIAIYAAYATCRLADDLADEGLRPDQGLLDRWEAEVESAYAGNPSHPVTRALHHAIQNYPIPKNAFLGLIRGCRQDFAKKRYANLQELLDYCELVASSISEISLAVFGTMNEETPRLGRRLSTALQLTNIIRDVAEDAGKDRIYLPRNEMENFQVTEEQILKLLPTSGMHPFLEFQCRRAMGFFKEAADLPNHVEPDSRLAVKVMAGVYRRILEKILKDPLQVFRRRVRLNPAEKARVILQCIGLS